MKRYLLAGAVALQLSPFASAAPRPVPKATPIPRMPFTEDNQIIQSGSFELPHVTKRTPVGELPNFVRSLQGEWIGFAPNNAAKMASLKVGLTNETAHAGRQSIYVDFDQVKTPGAQYTLASSLIPIKPDQNYHVNLWGRLDDKRPLVPDQRMPVLRLRVDFIQGDGQTASGEPRFKTQPLPGDLLPNRPVLFSSARWTEYYSEELAPSDAAFIKVTWVVGTPEESGISNGEIYLDDFGISGEKAPFPELADKPTTPPGEPAEEGAADEAGTPAAPGKEMTPGAAPAPETRVPSSPGTPVVPGNPSKPGTPVAPGAPVTTGIPVTPGTPVTPGASVTPDKSAAAGAK